MNPKLFGTILLIALVSIFIVQNADVVELRFLLWKTAMSRALMFIFLVLSGIAIGWLLHGHMLHKTRHRGDNDKPKISQH